MSLLEKGVIDIGSIGSKEVEKEHVYVTHSSMLLVNCIATLLATALGKIWYFPRRSESMGSRKTQRLDRRGKRLRSEPCERHKEKVGPLPARTARMAVRRFKVQ